MKLIRKMMISCEKAGRLVEKKLAGEIKLHERFQLAFHNRICQACRLYEQQSALIQKAIGHIHHIEPQKAPRHLKETILEALK